MKEVVSLYKLNMDVKDKNLKDDILKLLREEFEHKDKYQGK